MAGKAAAILQSLRGDGPASSSARAPGQGEPENDGGVGLRKYLLGEYKSGRLSAKALCTVAWHASRAGAIGVEDLTCNPNATHQAEHVRAAIHARTKDSFYHIKLP
eukprot:15444841-Alexandrium_andersonii.AAC.1